MSEFEKELSNLINRISKGVYGIKREQKKVYTTCRYCKCDKMVKVPKYCVDGVLLPVMLCTQRCGGYNLIDN